MGIPDTDLSMYSKRTVRLARERLIGGSGSMEILPRLGGFTAIWNGVSANVRLAATGDVTFSNVFTEPEFRHQGRASQMIGMLEQKCREVYGKVEGFTVVADPMVAPFWISAGYHPTGAMVHDMQVLRKS